MDSTGKYCKYCRRRVLAVRPRTMHLLHLIMTLLTGGFWIIIWFGCAVKFGGWRCSNCGSKV